MTDKNSSSFTQKENNAVCGVSTKEDRDIRSGDLFLHFKNKLYQIITVAVHSETEEALVVYQALYGDYKVYARPLEMFLSEVDHKKYPDVRQKYRFEKVKRDRLPIREEKETQGTETQQAKTAGTQQPNSMETQQPQPEDETVGPEDANYWLIRFLDTDSYEEKSAMLKDMENEITDRMINNLAAALDVVIPEGPLSERFRQLRICVDTKKRYETGRLR